MRNKQFSVYPFQGRAPRKHHESENEEDYSFDITPDSMPDPELEHSPGFQIPVLPHMTSQSQPELAQNSTCSSEPKTPEDDEGIHTMESDHEDEFGMVQRNQEVLKSVSD